jgi:uncharacterized protein (DUF2147 family)
MLFRTVSGWALWALAGMASAQNTPIGLWKSMDDKTAEAKAEIRIKDSGAGVLTGVVERSLVKDGSTDPNCDLCTDDRRGKPKLGLEIIRGAKKSSDKDAWESGKILDPENGKSYTLSMVPLEGGKKLQIRGYIGPFYRTQVWLRVQ